MQTKEPGNPQTFSDECFALQIRHVDLLERNERAITQSKLWASGFSTAGITGRLGAVARSQRNRRPIALSFSVSVVLRPPSVLLPDLRSACSLRNEKDFLHGYSE